MAARLFLFGQLRLAQPTGAMALAFERRSQLLAHLAMRRSWVPRTELATMLWPHAPVEQTHANLRKTLFRLRGLSWAPSVMVRDQSLCFDGTSDVADFESAIAERRWSDALQIGDAPLLAGYDDDTSEPWSTWLRIERERLRRAWRMAAGHCLSAMSDPMDALALASRLLVDDPLDESALRAQMLAYAQQGHATLARAAYREYTAQLASEMGVAPSAELQALYRSVGAADNTPLPPAEADVAQQLIGRMAERRAVHARLEEGCRLLCLIGPGGVGKSSLARHLLAELAPGYPDGAAFIPLDDVTSIDALGTRLARELLVPLTGSSDPLQAVITFLHGRRMLLMLDNFEHLQPAAHQLRILLEACPLVQMVITSRVRLGLAAEQLLPLDGLPCPAAEDVDRLESFDAAQLFVRAAQAVEPALQPAAESAAIAEICRMVDGLPLALEIAAGWTRVLSCAAIADELRQGIELLTESDPARPARQASIAAIFEQSWRRLGPIERSTWIRLTVFRGGFSSDAARAVAGATLPLLATLADQSLLRKLGSRADLHPLLRQLAATKLAGKELELTRAAHAVYYLQGVVPLLHGLKTGNKDALQQVETDFENLRTAWHWACTHGPAVALRSAAWPLMRFCDLRGHRAEGLALLREAAAGIGAADPYLGPLLDATAAYLEFRLERYSDAQASAARALSASRCTRDHDTRVLCFRVLGSCAGERGRLPRARRRFRQALAEAPAEIDPRGAVSMLMNLATVEMALGHYDVARTLYGQALVEQRHMRDVAGEALCLNNLAALELNADGRIDDAAAHAEASLALCEHHALTGPKIAALMNLTDVAVRRNDVTAVQRHGQRAFELAEQVGARGMQLYLRLRFAQLAMQQRDFSAARAALGAAVLDGLAIDRAPLQLDCVLCLANLYHAQGESSAALRLLRYAIAHPATAAYERERSQRRLAEWSASDPEAAALPAPALDLWTLLHRIVAETSTAHAALVESLRTA